MRSNGDVIICFCLGLLAEKWQTKLVTNAEQNIYIGQLLTAPDRSKILSVYVCISLLYLLEIDFGIVH